MDQRKVFIKKFNNNFYKFYTLSPEIETFLNGVFKYSLPNFMLPKRIRKFKKAQTVNLIKNKCELPIGLLEEFLKVLINNKIEYEFEEGLIESRPTLDYEFIENLYTQKLKLSRFNKTENRWEAITPFDFQLSATYFGFNDRRVLIESATSSGKSLVIYMTVVLFLMELLKQKSNKKILIVISTIQLVEQLYKDFCEYSHLNGINIEKLGKKISMHYTKEVNPEQKIVISTWQSLINIKDDSFFENYEYFISDEVHEADIPSLKSIMEKCVNATSFIGYTGSFGLMNDQMKKLRMMSLISMYGPVRKIINAKELIDKNLAARIFIKPIHMFVLADENIIKLNEHLDNLRKLKEEEKINDLVFDEQNIKTKKLLYHKEASNVFNSSSIYDEVSKIIEKNRGKNGILFFTNKKYGRRLASELESKKILNNIFYIDGDIDVNSREDIKMSLETSFDNLLIASAGTSKKGISINNLHYAILFQPGKDDVTIIQMLGRTMRKSALCNDILLYDYAISLVDYNGKMMKHGNYLLNQHKERMKIYKHEGHI